MHLTFTDPSASLSPPGAVVFAGAAKLGGSDVHEWSFQVEQGTGTTFGIVDGQYDPRTGAVIVILW